MQFKKKKIMNKTELIDKIAEKSQLSKADAKKALDATTEALKEALVAGDKIQLVGFGTFSVTERPAREGINPATKQKIQIAAKKVAKFKAGAELADAVNK
ncbi:MAG: HU family DNA-binding protein [Prevotellaceae bacterium]|nr:HU family DNA-binding protein [Prevotellaceae bacterium]